MRDLVLADPVWAEGAKASRIRAVHDSADLRVGIAMCPDDGHELLDAADVALRRMRGFALVEAVAEQMRRATHGPVAASTRDAMAS